MSSKTVDRVPPHPSPPSEGEPQRDNRSPKRVADDNSAAAKGTLEPDRKRRRGPAAKPAKADVADARGTLEPNSNPPRGVVSAKQLADGDVPSARGTLEPGIRGDKERAYPRFEVPAPDPDDPAASEATVTQTSIVSASLSGDTPVRPRRHVQLARGTTVGRYVVVDELGAGAMGAVYRAYDPDLDRSVALKVVDSTTSPNASARLVREAKALAQLSHPNVVSIHDVGSFGDDVFIAMGLVEGKTLRQWQHSKPKPSLSEIIEVFAAAGRGLAAAHHAGLIHRDFKPDNVLLGNDGRVQVVDFGIARTREKDDDDIGDGDWSDSAEWDSVSSGETSQRTPALSAPLTRDGALVGTPAYMSPEQFLCRPADAKSDQFSFCIALYEALYGKRPFAGRYVPELRTSTLAGKIRPPPADSRVPARLRKIVERGMRLEPDQRYPSMDVLIADLTRDPLAAVKRTAVVVGIAAIIGLTMLAVLRGPATEPTLCKGAGDELAGTWDRERRESARAAFIASKSPFAGATFERIARELDRYTNGWVAMRTETCEATHIDGTQSEHLLDLRMSCLDRRLGSIAALVAIFTGTIDADTVEKALPATFGLPPLTGCADADALTAAIPPPEDPKMRDKVARLRRQLDDAQALETTGRYQEALAVIDEVEKSAEGVPYEPLHAETLLLDGLLHLRTGAFDAADRALADAIVRGSRAKDDSLVSVAWTYRMETLSEQAKYDLALELAISARSAIARAGDDKLQRGLLERAVGGTYYAKGDYELAIKHKQLSLELVEQVLGKDHPTIATSLNALGNNYYTRGLYKEARAHYERALAIREKALGAEHPLVALSVYNLAILAYSEPDYQRSEEMFRRALRLFQEAYGEEHPHTAAAYHGLGSLMLNLGRVDEAEPLLRRSLELREKVLPPGHPMIGSSLHTLAEVLNKAERPAEAEQHLKRALDLWEDKLGPAHPKIALARLALADARSLSGDLPDAEANFQRALDILQTALGSEHDHVAVTYTDYARALARVGRWPAAEEKYRNALAIYEKTHNENHPDLSEPLTGLGLCYLNRGKPGEARPVLERALAIRKRYAGGDRYLAAQNEFALGRALWSTPDQRERARELVARARGVFVNDRRPSAASHLAQVDKWLRQRKAAAPTAAALP